MRRVILRGLYAALVAGAVSAPAAALAGDRCEAVEGPFSSVTVPPPTCTSAVGLCTSGLLQGDLEATYEFTADTMGFNPLTGRVEYTGHSVITPLDAPKGQLFAEDTGWLVPDAYGGAVFETTAHIVSGSYNLKKSGGTLVAGGFLSFVTGEATGSYSGTLCKDKTAK
jgi:hypothetical protein